MASTNPFQQGNARAFGGVNETTSGSPMEGRKARRAAGQSAGTSRGNRAKQRKEAARAGMENGFPAWEGLKPVISFLMAPGLLGVSIALTGPWPVWLLYFFAGLMGLWVLSSAFKGVELVLACFLLYLPFSTSYVIPIAPGINGTNMLIVLGLFASVTNAMKEKRSIFDWPTGSTLVFLFAALSALSGVTAAFTLPDGFGHMMHELLNYKGWIDQFILYFICLSCIRSIDVAKRVVIYMCIGSIVLMIHTVPEMLEKAGRSSIEKSRLGGPHIQPNMFGGFVAYSMLPMVALFVTYIKDIRAWLMAPYFLLAFKVLIGTFSRGAYVAMAAGAFLAAYFKGKGFLIMWATLAVSALLVFPSLFPEAIKARIGVQDATRTGNSAVAPKLDKSSETRLILWRAGGAMIVESPILGKGFKGFPSIKAQYTEIQVKEKDPHSTYIYIAAQMGLPALILFLLILAYSFHLGRLLSRNKEDLFIRAIGVGGASATVCYAIICVFGSRAVNLEFTAYFWAMLVCMQTIKLKLDEKGAKPRKKRTNAHAARSTNAVTEKPAVSGDEVEALEATTRLLPAPAGQRVKARANGTAGGVRDKRRRLKQHRGGG